MRAFVYSTIVIFLCVGAIFTQDIKNSNGKNVLTNRNERRNGKSHLDLIIDDISSQQWRTEELVCRKKVLNILNNVKNSTLWATWIWDSMQSPTGIFYGSRYQLGNYDQCMKAPWLETHTEYQTKYCLADIKLSNEEPHDIIVEPHSPVKTYLNSVSKLGVTFNTFTWGVCLPVECNSNAISKIVGSIFNHTHLGITIPIVDNSISSCQISGTSEEYSTEYYLNMYVFAFAIMTAIICTAISNNYDDRSESIGSKFIKAFCIKQNTANLTRTNKEDILVMHGIRSITSVLVVGLHIWFINNWVGMINQLDLDRDIENYNLDYIYHAELLIDTYLMMSGLLLIKGLMSLNTFNPLLIIFKRYLRFVCVLGLLMLFSMHVLIHSGDGPLWPRIAGSERNFCSKTWWLSLLMLGNYVDTANICYPVLWTVPCDFHLSTVGTLLYWLFKKNRRLGFALFTVLSLAALIMPGVVTYQQQLVPVPAFDMRTVNDFRNIIFTNPIYVWSHLRAGPYFVGFAAGYLMSVYKPREQTNVISKVYAVIGFIISFVIATQVLLMGRRFHLKNRPYDLWEAALFASFNRTIWALATACLIAFCEYGTVPLVGNFLKLPVFLPLSKLSYGIYLVHSLIFSRIAASTRTPLRHDLFLMIVNAFGVTVVCLITSLILHLLFEAPMGKIINILINTKKNESDHFKVKKREYENDVQGNRKKNL